MIMTDADQLREALRLVGEELEVLRKFKEKHPCQTWNSSQASCSCPVVSKSEMRRLAVQRELKEDAT